MHFCSQLQSPSLNEEIGNQVIKNLVYLAKVFFRMGAKSTADPSGGHPSHGDGVKRDLHDDDDDDDGPTQDVSENVRQRTFLWLLRKICKEARIESSQNPKATVRRSCVFKWLAAVALELGGSNLSQYLYTMLLPLHREITNTIAENTEVKNLASEVMELMKTQVGVEEFSRVYAMVTTAKAERRLQRKRSLAVEVITDPQAAVRKKIKRNLKKQDNRKRKIETKRPGKKINKRKKLSEMAIQMD
ncbi:PREDICTED: small subunit processome component 20 homolog [Priapulus caudatus]|uniref:Small subunit processome component 20 homolog n=1 Tax=Priapulus caudatus TaxID=37621 RepID=A0ABM1EPF8_PRICU|nr:PREDICTED: small subunit processome component 20 homolog [Priapulus caudatus]